VVAVAELAHVNELIIELLHDCDWIAI